MRTPVYGMLYVKHRKGAKLSLPIAGSATCMVTVSVTWWPCMAAYAADMLRFCSINCIKLLMYRLLNTTVCHVQVTACTAYAVSTVSLHLAPSTSLKLDQCEGSSSQLGQLNWLPPTCSPAVSALLSSPPAPHRHRPPGGQHHQVASSCAHQAGAA